MTPPPSPVTCRMHAGSLEDSPREAALTLAAEAARVDGAAPLGEQTLLRMRHGGDPADRHVTATTPDSRLVGYAYLDRADPTRPVGELVVAPSHRRIGIGRALAEASAAADRTGPGPRWWAHGDHPGAAALAQRLGYRRARVLHQLRRPLTEPVPAPGFAPEVRLRSFRPGEDDQAWLALNARAFADHPEQGRLTHEDLRRRMAEPWFDPAGFLLAVHRERGDLLGFHWTKVHGPGNEHHHCPIGEVYVLGVDPAAHGLGLGRALTLAGLAHLRDRGLDQVLLYVDESNQPAMRLYTGLGFTSLAVDVMYARQRG